jgi:hypothetical protein
VEVKFSVDDPNEIVLLAQFQNVINEYRAGRLGATNGITQNQAQGTPVEQPVVEPVIFNESFSRPATKQNQAKGDGVTDDTAAIQAAYAPDLNNRAPEGSQATDLSDIAIARAITTFGQTHGIAAAQSILAEFGVTKATAIPDEQRYAFLVRVANGAK